MRQFYTEKPSLKPNFAGASLYPACTANLGPHTVCLDHLDSMNYPGCPCVITAIGDFNPDQGGQLYFPQLQLFVRFPPGCTALLCSAALRHGNTQLSQNDVTNDKRRFSFTQFVPGGIVRYVQAGFKMVGSFKGKRRVAMEGGYKGARRDEQLARLSTQESLSRDRASLQKSHHS
ncbi:uncharacterized protein BXZ73DRAFT_56830 [Epithele typhae]|uniref:uncharacterized protein n=1 Tax=Epithele typhae TaxID=378194 RepID=UPI002008DEF3|nr:uncharacterized protein BXZ73DRAFT_60037 [Epithele typhae]XP_047871525.1 uncharacterized protein BXZ73DRAFT_56830 [Epithele typhae]KAH9908236.1 hypothetical protein BXZ73DRAFT_60037 [Epithele typhae]KAH9911693.1 hypothetical protein BXZ73DRAFT_56830 [Epithele typhae]